MSASCCNPTEPQGFTGQSPAYRRTLWAVIAINATMFFAEVIAGWSARSQSLQADALDFLADSATYGATLWAIGRPIQLRSNVAMIKGVSLAVLAAAVFAGTVYRTFFTVTPVAEVMGATAVVALLANLAAAALLLRFRDGDANVRSVWLCTRNDAIGNVAVLAAAGGVWGSGTAWPDLIVAAGMTALFLWSSVQIIGQARGELRTATA